MNLTHHPHGVICVSPDLRPGLEPILRSLDQLGGLEAFVTPVAFSAKRAALGPPLPGPLGRAYTALQQRRIVPDFVAERTHTWPARELLRTGIARWGRSATLADRVWWWSERGFDRHVARRWSGKAPYLYGFEVASAETFRAQKRAGGETILCQLIAHPDTIWSIMREEMERFPDAVTDYERHLQREAGRVTDVKLQQYAESDLIVANSPYVRDTFLSAGFAPERIAVVPGAGPVIPEPDPRARCRSRMIFMSAGQQSLRKGTPYLLDAWRSVGDRADAELWMVGKNLLPDRFMQRLPGNVQVRGTVPHSELFELYGQASVLVLPSLCEGFALVILEAMAHGMAVITTPNSGCGDFVEDGVNGWVVPIRDTAALAARLSWCIENRDAVDEMGRVSRRKASAWTWEHFVRRHTETLAGMMDRGAAPRTPGSGLSVGA